MRLLRAARAARARTRPTRSGLAICHAHAARCFAAIARSGDAGAARATRSTSAGAATSTEDARIRGGADARATPSRQPAKPAVPGHRAEPLSDNRADVCPLRRRRQVPRRPRDVREPTPRLQVELDSGKRVKVKAANVLLRFDKPAAGRADRARPGARAATIDLDLAWEFAPEGEFGFADLARDYFDASAGAEQQAAALFRLFEAPHYFRRARQGPLQKAPEEIVKAALLGIERKKQVAAQIDAWAAELVAGQLPGSRSASSSTSILFKPDKNAPEYKAVVEAVAPRAARAARPAEGRRRDRLARTSSTGGASCSRSFPKGTGFPPLRGAADQGRAAAGAGRRRSRSTTRRPPRSTTRCRCRAWAAARVVVRHPHRRAGRSPSQPDSPLDKVARERLSTVYMPGHKITMLPDDVVAGLHADRRPRLPGACRSTSRFDEATLDDQGAARRGSSACRSPPTCATTSSTRVITEADARPAPGAGRLSVRAPSWPSRSASRAHLKAQREVVRGKPENFNRPDYNFRLERQRRREPHGRRDGADQHAPARRAAGPDRRRGDDPGQQHLGRLARRVRRAGHLPQPGQPGAGREGAHGHARPRRTPASAWRSTPGAPRRCAATSTSSTSGRSSPARATAAPPRWPRRSSPRTPSCSRSSRASTRPTPPTTASRPASSASGRCVPAAERHHRARRRRA